MQVLSQPMQSASPQQIAYHSLTEQCMDGRRLSLARQLLLDHAPADLPAFLFKWERAAEACELLYPPVVKEASSSSNGVQQNVIQIEVEGFEPEGARQVL